MRKDSSTGKTEEIRVSLETVDSKKVSLVKEFYNWNLYVDCVSGTREVEPPDSPVYTRMIHRDEPNYFHF